MAGRARAVAASPGHDLSGAGRWLLAGRFKAHVKPSRACSDKFLVRPNDMNPLESHPRLLRRMPAVAAGALEAGIIGAALRTARGLFLGF